MRGGVEDDVGSHVGEDLVQPLPVADVGDDAVLVVEQPLAPQLQLEAVQVGLVVVEHDQPGGREAEHLAAQLAADRAARPRHQDHLVADHRRRLRADHVHLVAADQPAHVEPAHVAADHRALESCHERRQVPHARAGTRGRAGHLAEPLGLQAGNGQDDDVDRFAGGDLGHILERAEHRQVEGCIGSAVRVVVDEPDRDQAELGGGGEVARQRAAGDTGARDQRAQEHTGDGGDHVLRGAVDDSHSPTSRESASGRSALRVAHTASTSASASPG